MVQHLYHHHHCINTIIHKLLPWLMPFVGAQTEESIRRQSWYCVWDTATLLSISLEPFLGLSDCVCVRVCGVTILWNIITPLCNKCLMNLHWCAAAFCTHKSNHTCCLYIYKTLQPCYHFGLYVTCASAEVVNSAGCSKKHSHQPNVFP
jgi:hypothetical protein